jgi:carbon storage regulator
MLVISRRKGDSLVIGESIEISVVDIHGDKVRIGVTCPKEMPVHRQEVYEAICRHSSSSASPAGAAASAAPAAGAPLTSMMYLKPEPVPQSAAPATLVLAADHVARLDKLRAVGDVTREAAVETLLQVVDRAGVTSLCDLERRLRR